MTRQLLCDACGHRNDETAVVCARCDHDLSYAEAVFSEGESAAMPPAAPAVAEVPHATTQTTGAFCTCAPASRVAGEAVCWACNLPYGALATPASELQPEVQAPRLRLPTSLELPGGVTVALGQGLVLGRDGASAAVAATGALSAMPGVSRVHAWLGLDSDCRLIVVDLGSRNGTWVGGTRLTTGIPQVIDEVSLPVTIHLGGRCQVSIRAGEVQ